MGTPTHLSQIQPRLEKFRAWLAANGSEIRGPTNEYEVLRFTTPDGIGIIYRTQRNALRAWTGGAKEAWECFAGGMPWRAIEKPVRKGKTHRLISDLMKRDGKTCVYCGVLLTHETATVEHMLSITHGGTSHIANLALACAGCNEKVGHMSVREKLEVAVKQRLV